MRRLMRTVVLLAVVVATVVLFIRSDRIEQMMYPIHYREDIRASASNYKVDPYLLAAIIRSETNYQTGRESSKGALGIMQIMPDTADWIIDQANFTSVTMDDIHHRADVSIEMGSWYIHSLSKQFDQNTIAAVAAYNAGPGNVKRWMSEQVWDGTLDQLSDVPFGETRHYVKRVFYYYEKYKSLYPTL
ncbi:lytic transglycosylase domain-containing protein [Paenibacillus sp. 1P07SE]|uniref:lytic transglycosylase domain-containing protein n=1 Tax=Paenibacillus sp. 1P07SE TaxID=3132209 RepID=UPI0039A77C8E